MSITKILQGINRCEVEYADGWWETESGATFGHGKLIEAQGYECGLLQRITELEAENERLIKVSLFKENVADVLRAQLADAKKDAERYRWLRDSAPNMPSSKGNSPGVLMTTSRGYAVLDSDNFPSWLDGEGLDAAVDAAIQS